MAEHMEIEPTFEQVHRRVWYNDRDDVWKALSFINQQFNDRMAAVEAELDSLREQVERG